MPFIGRKLETFTTSGTWTCPAGVYAAQVTAIGAGGGGTINVGGGGGGAYSNSILDVVPGQVYTVTVGTSAIDTNGGDSSFDSLVVAQGGRSGTNGGTGGATASGTGTTKRAGGNAGVGTGARTGGGGASDDAAGSGATGGADTGGAGGSTTSGSQGKPDGGGGNSQTSTATAGARGRVSVLWFEQVGPYEPNLINASINRQAATTSHSVTIPSGATGDRIIVYFATPDAAAITPPSGYDDVILPAGFDITSTTPDVRLRVFTRVATGSDTCTVTTASSVASANIVLRIQNYDTNFAPVGRFTGADSGNINPPSLPVGWLKDTLWLVAGTVDWGLTTATIGACPTGYSHYQYVIALTGNATLASAVKESETGFVEDPDTFSNVSDGWAAVTIGVKGAARPDWYNSAWKYRVPVVVRGVLGEVDELTDFPVYVDLSTLPTEFHAHVKAGGADIRVTEEDGETEVPREIVFYDQSTDTGEMHFLGEFGGEYGNTYYIYYGNAAASDYSVSDTYGAQNVWDSDYKVVTHFQNGSTLTVLDSTSNGIDPTSTTGIAAGTGQMDGAAVFDGSDEMPYGTEGAINSWTAQTISLWVNGNSGSEQFGRVIEKGANSEWTITINNAAGSGKYSVQRDSTPILTTTNDLSGGWHKLDLTIASDYTTTLYVDGIQDVTTSSSAPSNKTGQLNFGAYRPGGPYHFTGSIDEFRLSSGSTPRSADWLLKEFRNQDDPLNFYLVGVEEEGPESRYEIFVSERLRVSDGLWSMREGDYFYPVVFGTTGQPSVAFEFTVPDSTEMSRPYFTLGKVGAPADNISVEFAYTHDGVTLTSSTVAASSLTGTNQLLWSTTLSTPSYFPLTPGGTFSVRFSRSSSTSDTDHYFIYGMSDYTFDTNFRRKHGPGSLFTNNGSTWTEFTSFPLSPWSQTNFTDNIRFDTDAKIGLEFVGISEFVNVQFALPPLEMDHPYQVWGVKLIDG